MKRDMAQEIIILRAKHSLTQQQFAEKLGTSQRTVAAWESGDSVPRKTMRVRIARSFDLPDQYFLDGNEPSEPDTANEQIDKIMTQIDGVLSDSDSFSSEEEKSRILKRFQEVLTEMPPSQEERKP